ncbi:MAG TPA: hypothetical protein VKZ67_00470 [Natronosporangium sp.]|nr:hypothetical protein [Natronosporangium sp.]
MRVHSATSRSSSPLSSTPLPVTSAPAVPAPRSPRDWVRQWFGGRGGSNPTRLTSAEQRASHRLAQLGSAWQVVPWGRSRQRDHEGFLAVGPGGVFAVTVVDQGRHRVMMAGDVVQIHGRRPPLVSRARRAARRASEALTAAVGAKVPVVPVLTFVGSGPLSAHGLPAGCLVVSYRELDQLLLAAGEKITAETARKLAQVARHPSTWADEYRWYSDGRTASDNSSA